MPRVYPPLAERFWSKVDRRDDEDCWPWIGATNAEGYGRFRVGRDNTYAHRVSILLAGIEIPRGAYVDHLCENTTCVNPLHLEPVTHTENLRRSRELRNVA